MNVLSILQNVSYRINSTAARLELILKVCDNEQAMKQSSSFNQKETPMVKTGGVANPAEVKRAILEATKDIKRAERDFDKLIADKEELLTDLADLRMHEKQAEEKTFPASVKKVIERSVRSLQKRLSILNGVLPEVNLSADQKKIQTIIAEWKEGKRNFRNTYGAHLRAERKLAENPADHRAIGDANRTEAEMYVNAQKMDALAKEAELVVNRMTPDPVADGSVNIHTGEEPKSPVVSEEVKEQPQEPTPLAEQEPQTLPVEEPKHEEPSPSEKSEEQEQEQETFTNLLPPSVELPAPSPHELLEEGEYHASQEEAMSVPVPSVQPEEVSEVPAQPEVPAVEYGETIPVPTSVEERSETKKVSEEEEEAVPSEEEKSPSRAYAEKMLHSHLDTIFGVKGFLGFGGVSGKDSPHWSDTMRGFSRKVIEDVRTASPAESAERIGIENADEVAKMRAYIEKAEEETGVSPLPYESVSSYIIRALSAAHERTIG